MTNQTAATPGAVPALPPNPVQKPRAPLDLASDYLEEARGYNDSAEAILAPFPGRSNVVALDVPRTQ